jgi:hypothetical protein
MKESLRHLLNPLHVFCRLKQCGIPSGPALRVCSYYERLYAQIL